MFVGTANVIDTIPGPLRDRMEIIELPGYTEEEKGRDRQALSPEAPARGDWATPGACEITDDAIRAIIRDYTREAGVRNSSATGAICRHVATRVAEGKVEHMKIDAPICTRSSAAAASRAKSPCARASPACRPGLPGLPPAATSCSSNAPACPAAAG